MTIHEARMIRKLKKRATYRALAEIFYPEDHQLHGMQFAGEELCQEALEILYPGRSIWATGAKDENAQFGVENRSELGDFFWWE